MTVEDTLAVPPGPSLAALDVLAAAQATLPAWDVRADVLVRTVTMPGGVATLRGSLEQVAHAAGRVPEITTAADQITIRLRTAGGPPGALLDLATAMEATITGSPTTVPEP